MTIPSHFTVSVGALYATVNIFDPLSGSYSHSDRNNQRVQVHLKYAGLLIFLATGHLTFLCFLLLLSSPLSVLVHFMAFVFYNVSKIVLLLFNFLNLKTPETSCLQSGSDGFKIVLLLSATKKLVTVFYLTLCLAQPYYPVLSTHQT